MEARQKPEQCESCDYSTENLIKYRKNRNFPIVEEFKWLCDICASTASGNAFEYPEQYPNKDILQMIAYVGNLILAEIKK